MQSTIYLIRHGITEGNKRGWFYGGLDIPLEKEGIEEIKRLAAAGIYPDPEDAQLFTTGMLRTEQTLYNMYGKEMPHGIIAELKEYRFGILEGKTREELMQLEAFREFASDETGEYVIEAGESRNMFYERVDEGWKKLTGFHRLKQLSHRHSGLPATTIAVCHGGVIDRIANRLFGSDRDPWLSWIPKPAHGYRIIMKNSDPSDYEIL